MGDDTWEITSGPLPNEARMEAQQLAEYVVEESNRIARKFKKSRREIVLAAGLDARPSRSRSTYNDFKRWYAHHNPDVAKNSE
jgi:hypothetical protein